MRLKLIFTSVSFEFHIEGQLQDFVWRFIQATEENIVGWVEGAVNQDSFRMGSHAGANLDEERHSVSAVDVFRSFKRTGESNLNGTDRQEHYEVMLEEWLIENLNQRYVIPEDFNAYKMLTRPTAKGIFGNLHLWFHASRNRVLRNFETKLPSFN